MKPLSTNDFGPMVKRTKQRRRMLLAWCAGAFAPLAAFAQQPDKVRRIGFLAPRSRSTAANLDVAERVHAGHERVVELVRVGGGGA